MASSRKSSGAERARALELAVAQAMAAVPHGARVTAALSGGMDSVVLLELLRRCAAQCAFRLHALHVNHGLSPNAHAWEAFCRRHCARRRIPFSAVRVSVPGAGANLEAHARAARYAAFAAAGSGFVALAHHREDQAETLLLNLLRGSGVHGLAGMPPARSLRAQRGTASGVQLLRPLLGVARSELAAYARLRRLRWVEDESNRDPRFARNFLRLEVTPLLERRFAGASQALARSATHLREAAALLDELAAADCAAVRRGGGLDARRLMALGEARAANALRYFLVCQGEPPPGLARTREMLRQLAHAKADAQPAIDLAQGRVRRYRGVVELVPPASVDRVDTVQLWRGERRLRLADGSELCARSARGSGVSAARLQRAPVSIRRRGGGERLRLARAGRTRTLKNLLQEAGVAPWIRARMPLLYCGETLVWAPFAGIAADFRATPEERGWQFSWQTPAGDLELSR